MFVIKLSGLQKYIYISICFNVIIFFTKRKEQYLYNQTHTQNYLIYQVSRLYIDNRVKWNRNMFISAASSKPKKYEIGNKIMITTKTQRKKFLVYILYDIHSREVEFP